MHKSQPAMRFFISCIFCSALLVANTASAVSLRYDSGNFEAEVYGNYSGDGFSQHDLDEGRYDAYVGVDGRSYYHANGSIGLDLQPNALVIDTSLRGGTVDDSYMAAVTQTGSVIDSTRDIPVSPYYIGIYADTEPAGTLFDVTVMVDISGTLTASSPASDLGMVNGPQADATARWMVMANGLSIVDSYAHASAGTPYDYNPSSPGFTQEDFNDSNTMSFILADGDMLDLAMWFYVNGEGGSGADVTTSALLDGLITVTATPVSVSSVPLPAAAWLLMSGLLEFSFMGRRSRKV